MVEIVERNEYEIFRHWNLYCEVCESSLHYCSHIRGNHTQAKDYSRIVCTNSVYWSNSDLLLLAYLWGWIGVESTKRRFGKFVTSLWWRSGMADSSSFPSRYRQARSDNFDIACKQFSERQLLLAFKVCIREHALIWSSDLRQLCETLSDSKQKSISIPPNDSKWLCERSNTLKCVSDDRAVIDRMQLLLRYLTW